MSGYRQSMEKFFYLLGSWAFRHRFVSTGIALAVLIATASQVPKLDTETSILSMFHENDPARVVSPSLITISSLYVNSPGTCSL